MVKLALVKVGYTTKDRRHVATISKTFWRRAKVKLTVFLIEILIVVGVGDVVVGVVRRRVAVWNVRDANPPNSSVE